MNKIALLFCVLLFSCQESEKDTSEKVSTELENVNQTQTYQGELVGESDPIASPEATVGGTLKKWGSLFPKSLNYWLDQWHISAEISHLQFESLVSLHSTENKFRGVLAESWEMGADSLSFTFKIRPEAKWSDGKAITAGDFQFYYDVMMNPKNLTPAFRVGLKRFLRPEVIDEQTIKIVAKKKHWSNFNEAGGLMAFPEHIWKDVDFNKQRFDFPVTSGPYRIKGKVKKGRSLTMERRTDWWGWKLKYNEHKYNFKYIKYKFMEDQNKVLESFKKGELDVYAVYTSSIWMKKTNFPAVKNGWVVRQQVYNQEPKGFQGFAINMRREKFKDVRVRQALAHLVNRRKMNEKLMFNVYFLLNSYFPDLYPNNLNPEVDLAEFEPDKARALLKEAGWKVNSKGYLAKNGKVFDIVFYTAGTENRHLNIYIEDLKAVGIKSSIEKTSKSTLTKKLDDKEFDMYWSAFGAGRLRDPESQWHSDGANQKASHNYSGVADEVIDSLIEVQKGLMNVDKRNDVLKAIDRRLNEIVPFALLWQSDHARMLYWNKFGTPTYVLDKYNREDIVAEYWWLDKEKEAQLEKAKKEGSPLPMKPLKVHYRE